MAGPVYIASVGTYEGPLVAQKELIEKLRPIHGAILDKVSRNPMIETRQLHGYNGGHSLAEKQQATREQCLRMAIAAVEDAVGHWDGGDIGSITHVIMCTSTEYMAPTLETRIMAALKMDPSVMRVPVVMAGCAAGGIALQLAYHMVAADATANVLIMAAEYVTPDIHKPSKLDIDMAIATTIFSDGAGAMIVSSRGKYRISRPVSYTIPDTLQEMEIEPSGGGIRLALSRNIHTYTSEHIAALVDRMMSTYGRDGKVDGYILHPGGKSILNAITSKIGDNVPIVSSWEVLAKYGNTSSSAIFYVMKHAWDDISSGIYPIFTFGQGIHVAAIMLECQ